jgi:hypothetical protein
MKCPLSLLLAIFLIATLSGCGNIFVRGALPAGSSSVSGLVSVVQLSAIIGDSGTTVQVTFVTFVQGGASSTIGFCGDERSQFPMQQTVRANFTPGQTCASVITIVITCSRLRISDLGCQSLGPSTLTQIHIWIPKSESEV